MKRYSCTFLYRYKDEKVSILLSAALKILGFEPKYMDIFYDEFQYEHKNVNDVAYDGEHLLSILERKPSTIRLKSHLYDDENEN